MTVVSPSSLALQESVLIVAHPDDEILWFGSVGPSVGRIVICFLSDPAHPDIAEGRRAALARHPWRDRIVCLDMEETCAFDRAGWPKPECSDDGLKIIAATQIAAAYAHCAQSLRERLPQFVRGAANVFTHNPWGEYGHEEHVLVHRIVTAIAETAAVPVWYSSYASNWSKELMLHYLARAEPVYVSRDVDTQDMERVADIYRECGAWTWLDKYRWFPREYFVRGPLPAQPGSGVGWLVPINMINLPDKVDKQPQRRLSVAHRILRRLGYR